MHDFVEYPDAQVWEKGFSLISEAIKAETQTRNMPLDTFWLVSDIYGEKAHGLHWAVDTYAHLSVAFLTKLHAIVEQLLVGWRVVVFSDTAGEDFRVVISDEGVKVEKTVVAHNEPNGGY